MTVLTARPLHSLSKAFAIVGWPGCDVIGTALVWLKVGTPSAIERIHRYPRHATMSTNEADPSERNIQPRTSHER
jgi:hypothetical protein